MATSVPLHINGQSVTVNADDPDMPLLYALRDNLKLRGPRFGCGLEQCGSCTVRVDGEAVRSCITPLSSLKPVQKIVTLEGLARRRNRTRCRRPLSTSRQYSEGTASTA